MSKQYKVTVKKVRTKDGGGYFAYYDQFKGVMGDGNTEAEAIADAKEAFKAYCEVEKRRGKKIPEPKQYSTRVGFALYDEEIEKLHKMADFMKLSRGRVIRLAIHVLGDNLLLLNDEKWTKLEAILKSDKKPTKELVELMKSERFKMKTSDCGYIVEMEERIKR